jgi:hypothetical protein
MRGHRAYEPIHSKTNEDFAMNRSPIRQRRSVRGFFGDEHGLSTVEYTIILVLIALAGSACGHTSERS